MLYLKDRILGFIGFTISGCCLNVYTFEKLININSEITTLITFSQYLFIFIVISIYLNKISYWNKNDKGRNKNLKFKFNKELILPILLQVISSYIGNLVFKFNLSMPTHIIFRSSSTTMTIFLGWLFWNKKYEIEKIIGSTLIGIGTILFTIDFNEIEENPLIDNKDCTNFKIIGILLLILSTIINSLNSLYKEQIYQINNNNNNNNKEGKIEWKEVIYYNYFYGLIIYLPLLNQTIKEIEKIKEIINYKLNLIFLLNWITQLMCIVGVNLLVFKINALSLTIVLLIRRFLSLILSIYLFDNSISLVGFIGIINVFIGAIIYSFGNKIIISNKEKKRIKIS